MTARKQPPRRSRKAFPQARRGLEARYQRLVLLNRMSLELFSEKPFPEALASASELIASLTGARYVSVHFLDDFGVPFCASRRGDPLFTGPEAEREEKILVWRTLEERRILTPSRTRLGWTSAPLLAFRKEGPSEDGAILVGYEAPQKPGLEREQTLLEISRLLRNARLIQRNLQQQKTMAAVSEQSADAIIVTDLESRIVSWNPSATELFQYARREALGQPTLLLFPDERLSDLKNWEEETLRTGSVRQVETVCQRKDDSLVPVEATLTILKGETGAPFGMVCVYRDITKRKELERMRSEFVSLVSHELRTPLTSIRGFAETILEFGDQLSPEQGRQYLEVIVRESRRLGDLVTNFLDISRLEAGGVALKTVPIDLAALCERLRTLFHEHPSRAVLEVRFAPQAERAWGDEDQIYRLLINLCGNALKYSPQGGTIAISCRPEGRFVEISVADQGPGIASEHRQKIFEKFYRVADPVSTKTPGTGLGLAICKKIVEAHGGSIWVECRPPSGTAFKFTIPREAPSGPNDSQA